MPNLPSSCKMWLKSIAPTGAFADKQVHRYLERDAQMPVFNATAPWWLLLQEVMQLRLLQMEDTHPVVVLASPPGPPPAAGQTRNNTIEQAGSNEREALKRRRCGLQCAGVSQPMATLTPAKLPRRIPLKGRLAAVTKESKACCRYFRFCSGYRQDSVSLNQVWTSTFLTACLLCNFSLTWGGGPQTCFRDKIQGLRVPQ